MPERRSYQHYLPVHPNLDQLKHQAKELLRDIHTGDEIALDILRRNHPKYESKAIDPAAIKLSEAQHALARNYLVPSWPRLVTACRMTDAIWSNDVEAVRQLVTKNPRLLHESARGEQPMDNWGPPMSHAANLGRDAIIQMLREQGAEDLRSAFDRACLQGRIETAKKLHAMGARPTPGFVMGPCETLHAEGLQFVLELGVQLADQHGDRLAPIALLLETYSRYPKGKHGCFELIAQHGVDLPDTPTMGLHRGRIDLLEAHLKKDPRLFSRTFSHEEIYPPSLGCHSDHSLALHGTPTAGGTLLHIAVDFDEVEIARWMIEQGANVNAKAAIDAEGFGGHTALYGCIVSQPYRCSRDREGAFARLLLDNGADTNVRADLRKRLRFVEDETMHEYRAVTPLAWGQQFQDQDWVNPAAMKLLTNRGGQP